MDDHFPEPIEGIFVDLGEAIEIPPQWVITDLLPYGLTFLAAPPKSYKSTVTVAFALMVSGHQCKALPVFMRHVPQPGPVVLFSYEATAGELKDMAVKGMGIEPRSDRSILVAENPWSFRLDDADGLERLLYWLNELRPKLVVLDPLRDFHGLEEKDSGDMNRLLRPLRTWAVTNNACMIVVHHTRKPADSANAQYEALDMRGTSALFGIADGVLILSPTSQPLTVRVKATFKRAAGWDRTMTLAAYDNIGMTAEEELAANDVAVLGLVSGGAETAEEIGEQLRMKLSEVLKHLYKLERNNLVQRKDRKWVI